MKGIITKIGKKRWIVAWLVQIAVMLAAAALGAFAAAAHPAVRALALWGLIPGLGGYTAFWAVRRGLLNYAAWLAPPLCLYAAHFAVWGYAPSAGAALWCAFCALVGAAAGEVFAQQKRNEKRRQPHGKKPHPHL